MNDTTCLYYTGHVPPEPFLNRVRSNLALESGGLPIITISHQPINNFGTDNFAIGISPQTFYTAQLQILIGLDYVNTRYVAFCEDDTLYTYEHLHWTPPRDDTFYYNTNRWTLNPPPCMFWWAHRMNQSQLICSTDLAKRYFNARWEKISGPDDEKLSLCSEPGRWRSRNDYRLGLGRWRAERLDIGTKPLIHFNNKESLRGYRRVSPNAVIRDSLDGWGNATTLWNIYRGKSLLNVLFPDNDDGGYVQ